MDKNGTYIPEGTAVGRLELVNVHFAYPARPDTEVLRGLTLSIDPGMVLALVGTSGGGKSSTIKLMEYFYEANEGQVCLDGVPIAHYDHRWLHRHIAMVGQVSAGKKRSVAL